MRRGVVRLQRPDGGVFSDTPRRFFSRARHSPAQTFPAPGNDPKMRSRVERSAHAPRDGVSRGERERRASAVPIPASRAEFGVARSVCRVHPRRTLQAWDVSDRRGNRIARAHAVVQRAQSAPCSARFARATPCAARTRRRGCSAALCGRTTAPRADHHPPCVRVALRLCARKQTTTCMGKQSGGVLVTVAKKIVTNI